MYIDIMHVCLYYLSYIHNMYIDIMHVYLYYLSSIIYGFVNLDLDLVLFIYLHDGTRHMHDAHANAHLFT